MADFSGSREAFDSAFLEISAEDPGIRLVTPTDANGQNALETAAGLADGGAAVFLAADAFYITAQSGEQLRASIAYPNLNVKLAGFGGGLLGGGRGGEMGAFCGELGILRGIPGITVLTPADPGQVYGAVKAAAKIPGPVYIRCGGDKPGALPRETGFDCGRLRIIRQYGGDAVIFSNGFVLDRALEACERLKDAGLNVTLLDVSTLKPFAARDAADWLKYCGAAVTAEDHSIIGGLGSAVAETAAALCPTPVEFVGLRDIYPRPGAENPADEYGISAAGIIEAAKRAVTRKNAAKLRRSLLRRKKSGAGVKETSRERA